MVKILLMQLPRQRLWSPKMNLFQKYKEITEGVKLYSSGNGYTAKVGIFNGVPTAKFYKDGVHMKYSDYTHKDIADVHEFAQDEMKHRSKNVSERILEPEGHKETPDPITDDSEKGKGQKKKQMGNRVPLEIISKILAGR